jgi:DNA-binding GntR family transcriptional regulator
MTSADEGSAPRTGRLEPLQVDSAPAAVAARIRAAIFAGRFPPDAQLNEVELARELNVSRGPIREAFARMIHDGLLRRERNRGVFVVALDADSVRDIYYAREVVERAAAVRLAERHDEGALAELAQIVDALAEASDGEWSDLVARDLAFHRRVVALAGSVQLARAFEPLYAQTRLCLTYLEAHYDDRATVVAEHRTILAAIRAGRADRIEALIHEHMAESAAKLTAPHEGEQL